MRMGRDPNFVVSDALRPGQREATAPLKVITVSHWRYAFPLDVLLSASPLGTFTFEEANAARIWNAAAESIFGRAYLAEGKVLDTDLPGRAEQVRRLWELANTTVTPHTATIASTNTDYQIKEARFSVAPLENSHGTSACWMDNAEDVTRLAERGEERKRLMLLQQAIVNATGDGFAGLTHRP